MAIKLKRLPQPAIRMKVLPAFPARVVGGAGITVTKAGGTYTISVNQDFGAVSGPSGDVSGHLAYFNPNGSTLAASNVFQDVVTGRVGVGQTVPTQALHVGTGAGQTQVRIQSDASDIYIGRNGATEFGINAGQLARIAQDTTKAFPLAVGTIGAQSLIFGTDNIERARFDGSTGLFSVVSGIVITPQANTNNQGLVITQTSPTSGSVVGPLNFNEINVTNQGGVTTSGSDPLATHEARGLYIHMEAGGPNLVGFQNALRVRYDHTLGASDIGGADHIAAVFIAYSDQDATSRGIYGSNPLVWLASGAEHSHVVGSVTQVIAQSGSTATHRVGQRIYGGGPVQGSTNDAAITVVSEVAGWKNLIHLGELFDAQSLDTTASFFASGQAMTVANFASLANVSFTGNIMDFPNYSVSGAGAILGASLGLGGALAGGSKLTVTGAGNSARLRTLQSDGSSSTTGFSGLDASSNTSELIAVVSGSARTTTRYGLSIGGWAEVSVFDIGAGTNGLIIGTNPNKPIVFGTNDTERMRLLTGLSIGSTTDPGAGRLGASAGMFGAITAINSGVLLQLNNNTVALPAPGFTGTALQIGGADFSAVRIYLDGFSNTTTHSPSNILRRHRGTAASRLAVQAGDHCGGFFWQAYDGSGYTGDVAGMVGIAGENFNTGAHGMGFTFQTIPNGGIASVASITLQPSGGLSLGGASASDPGIGMLYTNSSAFMIRSKTAYNNGAGAGAGTLTNAPAAGNPTKWIPVDDNGTTRHIPAW
jgi:hypothetical protein